MRSGSPLLLWVVTKDQLYGLFTVHVSLLTPSPLPSTTEDVLITFFAGKKFYLLKFIPFVL